MTKYVLATAAFVALGLSGAVLTGEAIADPNIVNNKGANVLGTSPFSTPGIHVEVPEFVGRSDHSNTATGRSDLGHTKSGGKAATLGTQG